MKYKTSLPYTGHCSTMIVNYSDTYSTIKLYILLIFIIPKDTPY